MPNSDALAAVISHATATSGGLTIADSYGDKLTLNGATTRCSPPRRTCTSSDLVLGWVGGREAVIARCPLGRPPFRRSAAEPGDEERHPGA